MQTKSLIKIITKSKLFGVAIDDNGKFVLDLKNPIFLANCLVTVGLLSAYLHQVVRYLLSAHDAFRVESLNPLIYVHNGFKMRFIY